jgi:hypothetical protein
MEADREKMEMVGRLTASLGGDRGDTVVAEDGATRRGSLETRVS